MNKLLDFFKKHRKMIYLSIIGIIALVLIACFISKYFSFLLIILLGGWLFWNPAPKTNQSLSQEEKNLLYTQSMPVSDHIIAILNENKNFLRVAQNYDFEECYFNADKICTEMRFIAPCDIGKATVQIDELNKRCDEIQRIVFQRILNSLKRRTYNIDVSNYIKTNIYIKNSQNDSFYSIEVTVFIANNFFNYYLPR